MTDTDDSISDDFFMLDSCDDDDDDDDDNILSDYSDDEDPERDTSAFFSGAVKVSITVGKTTISVVEGDIAEQQVDVILNSTSNKLDLNAGTASKALLQAAGDSLQSECTEKYPHGIQAGELAVTGGGNISCKHVFHTSLVKWSDRNSRQIHKTFIKKSLAEVESRQLTSMAIPGLTTGFLRFPKRIAAKSKCIYIGDYLESNPDTTITDIRFVIHPSDEMTLDAFITEVKRWRSLKNAGRQSFPDNAVQCRDVFSTTIGNIAVTVKIDKIQHQEVDVIVNSVNSQLQLSQGSLSHSLVTVGGEVLQTECRSKYPNGLQVGQIAVTSGGNLSCKQVYHCCIGDFKRQGSGIDSKQIVEDIVKTCLETANDNSMTSVAFPCLGTRYRRYPAKLSAKAMLDGIREFSVNNDISNVTSVLILLYGTDCEKIARVFEGEGSQDATGLSSVVRGTKEFCSKMYNLELFPPEYWTHYTSSKSVKKWKSEKSANEQYYQLVELEATDNVYQAIENLVQDTWEASKVGHGRDAKGLGGYTQLQVNKIERLENIDLWESYGHFRSQLFHKASDIDIFDSLESLPNSKGPIKTLQELQPELEEQIFPEVNEVFLFHGTKADKFDAVISKGLDFRMAGDKAMFGSGTYMAESSTKADQYTDPKDQRSTNEEKKMILARVCLGKICLLHKSMNTLKKPPCSSCQLDACEHDNRYSCDSVIGDGNWIFREFVIYNQFQAYPEYVITYIRQ